MCVIVDHPQNKRWTWGGGGLKCVHLTVMNHLEESAVSCRWFSQSSVVVGIHFLTIVYTLAAICAHPPDTSILKFSHHWYGWKFTHYVQHAGFFFENMGEFSPRAYDALNYVCFLLFKILFFTNVHNFLQEQGEKSSWQSHEISFL